MRASADWASAGALGDVAIAFDNQVQSVRQRGRHTEGDNRYRRAHWHQHRARVRYVAGPVGHQHRRPGNGRIVTLASADPHGSIGTPITTQASPRLLAIAADGTIYVASPAARFADTTRRERCRTFTIATDSTACIGIDLSPDQSTLYVVSGGRNIRTITGVEKPGGPAPVAIFAYAAKIPARHVGCDSRERLTRVRPHHHPVTPSAAVGGLLIADKREIKRLNSLGAVVETFNAGPESDSQKDWSEIAVDPDTQAFFGIDAAQWRLARFRMGARKRLFR